MSRVSFVVVGVVLAALIGTAQGQPPGDRIAAEKILKGTLTKLEAKFKDTPAAVKKLKSVGDDLEKNPERLDQIARDLMKTFDVPALDEKGTKLVKGEIDKELEKAEVVKLRVALATGKADSKTASRWCWAFPWLCAEKP